MNEEVGPVRTECRAHHVCALLLLPTHPSSALLVAASPRGRREDVRTGEGGDLSSHAVRSNPLVFQSEGSTHRHSLLMAVPGPESNFWGAGNFLNTTVVSTLHADLDRQLLCVFFNWYMC